MGLKKGHIPKEKAMRTALRAAEAELPPHQEFAEWTRLMEWLLQDVIDRRNKLKQKRDDGSATTPDEQRANMSAIMARLAHLSISASRCLADIMDVLNGIRK